MEQSEPNTLKLYYRRMREKNNGEYPYCGSVVLPTGEKQQFIALPYKDLVVLLHEFLKKDAEINRVVFQRTERDDIMPVELGDRILKLLREDPLGAYRSMLYESAPVRTHTSPVPTEVVGKYFSDVIYLKMANGYVEDPETGQMLHLAYGVKQGWRIRRNDSKSTLWIPIDLVDDSPNEVTYMERVAMARWATVRVQDLLDQGFERYYLPREWNENGPWISHDNLKKRLDSYLAERKQRCH